MPGKPVQRVGDFSSGGGIAVGPGHNNVLVNGTPALMSFTPFTPHWGCSKEEWWHCIGVVAVIGNAATVRVNGDDLVVAGAKDSCITHSRIMGSPDVLAV